MEHRNSPNHIESYRYQSWQIEILIAGGILYGLFLSSDFLEQFFLEIYPIAEITSNKIILLFGSYVVTKILLIGFTANLLLRAVWLAYLGIQFWFPNDINYSKIQGSKRYKDTLRNEADVAQRLLWLEKWCNLSFSFAVLLAFFTISLVIALSVIIFILSQFHLTLSLANNAFFTYALVIVLVLIQIGLIERIFIRKKRNNAAFRDTKHFVFRLLNVLTLSFLFKREYLVLKTNTNRWALYGFIVLYLTIACLTSIGQIGEFYQGGTFKVSWFDDRETYNQDMVPVMDFSNYSENLEEGDRNLFGNIQSEVIDDSFVKLFVVSWQRHDLYLSKKFKENGFKTNYIRFENKKKQDSFFIDNRKRWEKSINQLFEVRIGGNIINNLPWQRYTHPITKEEGYMTYINIDNLPIDRHFLYVNVNISFRNGSERKEPFLQIPFWKK